MRSLILVVGLTGLLLFGVFEAKAADIEAKLDSSDGSSAFSVKDSGNTEVARINSDGHVTCTTINGLTPIAQSVGFTIAGGTTSKTLTVTGNATISGTPLVDPMTTRGDIIIRDSSNTTVRLGVGADNTVLSSDGTDVSWQVPTLTSSNSKLTSDVQMPTSGTWYDGPSVSLGAGTWLVIGYVTFARTATTATSYHARITDGTTHYASSAQYMASVTNHQCNVTMATVITLASTTTIKIQGTTNAGSTACLMKAAILNYGSGNNATQITAIRIG